MMTPKIVRLLVVVGGAVALVSACENLTARHVVVGTILATPAIEVKAGAIAGLDASFFDAGSFDASLPDGGVFDAGFLLDAGITVPPQTLAALFFGQLNGATGLDAPPTGIAGATVTLAEVGGGSWKMAEVGEGNYVLLGEDAGFAYKDNATYDFRIDQGGQSYIAEIEKVPARENITQLHPPAGYIDQQAGQPFTFARPDPPSGQDRNLGFVTVYPISSSGKGDPTYMNTPKTPLDYLKLVVAPTDWKQTAVTIPGTAFPDRDRNYLIVFQSGKLGGPKSKNLFTGSAVIGGTSEVGIVKTRP